jgi:hypothetical protein
MEKFIALVSISLTHIMLYKFRPSILKCESKLSTEACARRIVSSFFQLLFLESKITEEKIGTEIEFVRLFKFQDVESGRMARRKLAGKSAHVAALLTTAVNHTNIIDQV